MSYETIGDNLPDESIDATINRRKFLETATAGTFAIPAIITLSLDSGAALTSPPPTPPGESVPLTPERIPKEEPTGELAKTGADSEDLARIGGWVIIGGAAMHFWSARRKSHNPTKYFGR